MRPGALYGPRAFRPAAAIDPFDPSNAYVVHWDGTRWALAQAILEGSGGTFGVDLNATLGHGGQGVIDITSSDKQAWVAGDSGGVLRKQLP